MTGEGDLGDLGISIGEGGCVGDSVEVSRYFKASDLVIGVNGSCEGVDEERYCASGGGGSNGVIKEKEVVLRKFLGEEGSRVSCGVVQGNNFCSSCGYDNRFHRIRASSCNVQGNSVHDMVLRDSFGVGSVSGTKCVTIPSDTKSEIFVPGVFSCCRLYTSIFIGNIPPFFSSSDLKACFSKFGTVVDSFIPQKISKIDGSRFGFVRFREELDALRACDELDGSLCDGYKVIVNVSKFERSLPKENNIAGKFPKQYNSVVLNPGVQFLQNSNVGVHGVKCSGVNAPAHLSNISCLGDVFVGNDGSIPPSAKSSFPSGCAQILRSDGCSSGDVQVCCIDGIGRGGEDGKLVLPVEESDHLLAVMSKNSEMELGGYSFELSLSELSRCNEEMVGNANHSLYEYNDHVVDDLCMRGFGCGRGEDFSAYGVRVLDVCYFSGVSPSGGCVGKSEHSSRGKTHAVVLDSGVFELDKVSSVGVAGSSSPKSLHSAVLCSDVIKTPIAGVPKPVFSIEDLRMYVSMSTDIISIAMSVCREAGFAISDRDERLITRSSLSKLLHKKKTMMS